MIQTEIMKLALMCPEALVVVVVTRSIHATMVHVLLCSPLRALLEGVNFQRAENLK